MSSIRPYNNVCSKPILYTDDILMTALTLYMENSKDHPLPTPEEVLICTSSTTAEEVFGRLKHNLPIKGFSSLSICEAIGIIYHKTNREIRNGKRIRRAHA